MSGNPFDEIFRRMMRQFFKDLEDMERRFESQERSMRKQPEYIFGKPDKLVKSGGFSISISSNGKNPPRVEVKRFGPSGKWEKVPVEGQRIMPEAGTGEKEVVKLPTLVSKPPLRSLKERVIPEYDVTVDVNGVTITMNAQGVESEDKVRLKFYPESVEIYATAPQLDKEYFCTVALPASIDKRGAAVKVDKSKVIIRIPRRLHATQSR